MKRFIMLVALSLLLAAQAAASPVFLASRDADLVRMDIGTQTVTPIGPFGVPMMADLDFGAPNALYAIRQGQSGGFPPAQQNKAYRVDPNTGTAVLRGDFGFNGFQSLAYRSTNQSFYSVNQLNGNLSVLNLETGAIAPVSGSAHGLPGQFKTDALAFAPDGTLYGVWNFGNDFIGNKDFRLVSFNLTTGAGTHIGAIGINRNLMSLRFDSQTGTAYTVDATSGDVLSIDLTSGAGTVVWAGALQGVTGLAYVPEPATLSLVLAAGAMLLRRKR